MTFSTYLVFICLSFFFSVFLTLSILRRFKKRKAQFLAAISVAILSIPVVGMLNTVIVGNLTGVSNVEAYGLTWICLGMSFSACFVVTFALLKACAVLYRLSVERYLG